MKATIFKTSGDGSQERIGEIRDSDGVKVVSGESEILARMAKRYKTVQAVVDDHSNSSRRRFNRNKQRQTERDHDCEGGQDLRSYREPQTGPPVADDRTEDPVLNQPAIEPLRGPAEEEPRKKYEGNRRDKWQDCSDDGQTNGQQPGKRV